jgi:hypothetical protein
LENRRFCLQCSSSISPTAHAVAPSNLSPFETNIAIFPTHFVLETTRNAPLPVALRTESANIPCATITSFASATAPRHFGPRHAPQSIHPISFETDADVFSTAIIVFRNLLPQFIPAAIRKSLSKARKTITPGFHHSSIPLTASAFERSRGRICSNK